jgi:2-polyprenyl-3-methyl-5-hydroxy-6-metoxy-1,4-benzoquinol methylase
MNPGEEEMLLSISRKSLYAAGIVPPTAMRYCFKILSRYLQKGTVLEMGPAEGIMTELLVSTGLATTVVDGSALFCRSLRERFPQITAVQALFEEFEPEDSFENVVMGHVLEHVEDPIRILKRVRNWLSPGGHVFCAVPNARSLHRQAAVIMGLLPYEDALNELDIHHGHRRVFNPETLRNTFIQAGFRIEVFGGYFLKPISNGQIENAWTQEMIDAFMRMGERYPDVAGEIYVLAERTLPHSQ